MPRMPASNGYRPGFATVGAPQGGPVSVGGGLGGLKRLGDTLADIGSDVQQRENRAIEQKAREVEQVTRDELRDKAIQQDQAQREARAEWKAAGHLKAANEATKLELDAAEHQDALARDLRGGRIKREEFESKSQEFLSNSQAAAKKRIDPAFHGMFDQASQRPIRMAQINAGKVLRDHTRDELVAAAGAADEELQRMAIRDPERALAAASALYGPKGDIAATLGVDVAQKRGQAFTEKALRSHYLAGIESNRDTGKGLAALHGRISSDTRLDPTQQTALLASIDSRMGVLETRNLAAQARAERQQTQAFQSLQTLAEQGLPMKPEFVAQTMATLKGSPLAASAAALVQGQTEAAGFGAKSPREQDVIIQAKMVEARQAGVDPEMSAGIGRLKKIRAATESAIKDDPWRAASDRGLLDSLPGIDTRNMPALVASVKEILQQAPIVDEFAGRIVSPLRPAQAAQLADTLEALPIPEKTKMLGAMMDAIGPQRMLALSEQLKSKNDTIGIVAAYKASGNRTEGGHDLGELYLRGDQAIKDKTVKVDDRAVDGTKAVIAKKITGAYGENPSAEAAAKDAVFKVWAGLNAGGKSISPEEAVDIALGGVMERNGAKFVKPYGWTDKQVEKSLAAVTGEHIATEARAPKLQIGTQEVLAEDVPRYMKFAQLRPAGRGRYSVVIGDRMLMNSGVPFTMSLPDVR